jgi:Fe-S oxidoreductase
MPKHRDGDKTFPYGISTIYCTLLEHGYDARLVDCVVSDKPINELICGEEIAKYDIVGLGGLISAYKRVKHEIVPFIKKHAPKAMIIIGGYLGISSFELLLNNKLCNVVFLGDAEESILEFLGVYEDTKQWKGVRGIAYKEGENIVNTGVRVLNDLENVYIPYYKYIDIPEYNRSLPVKKRYYPLIVEVGCPFKCNFCLIHLAIDQEVEPRKA